MKLKISDEDLDALADKRAKRQCGTACDHTNAVWMRHIKIGYEDGFRAAESHHQSKVDKLLEVIEAMREAADNVVKTYNGQMIGTTNKVAKLAQTLAEIKEGRK